MNPLSFFRRRFKMYKAFSRNPRRSMATDIARTTFLMGLVALAAWMSYSIVTQKNPPPRSQVSSSAVGAAAKEDVVAQVASADTTEPSPDTRELPASEQLQPEENTSTPITQLANQDNIHDSNWILSLPDEKFIVQIGSSPDRDQLYQDAKAFPVSPVSFYPFKFTPTNRTIYGFAAGIYDSLEQASLAIKQWPESALERDPWIRPIDKLKQEIQAVAN